MLFIWRASPYIRSHQKLRLPHGPPHGRLAGCRLALFHSLAFPFPSKSRKSRITLPIWINGCWDCWITLLLKEVSCLIVSFFVMSLGPQKIIPSFKILRSYWPTFKFGLIFYALTWREKRLLSKELLYLLLCWLKKLFMVVVLVAMDLKKTYRQI